MMGEPVPPSTPAIHLLEPPRAMGGRDRGRESSLLGFALLRTLDLLEPGHVVLLGDAKSREAARAHAIAWDRAVTPVAGRLGAGWPAIRREIAGAALVRCWSIGALRVVGAIAGAARLGRIRATLVEAPRGVWDRRVVRLLGSRLDRLDVFDGADADAWRAAGVPADRVHAHEPGDLELSGGSPRAFARPTSAPPGRPLLTTLGDHPMESDARRLSFLLAIMSVGEYAAVALCPEGARNLDAGRRYHRLLGERYGFALSDRPTVDLLRAADVCVWPDPTERSPARGARALWRAAADRLGVEIIDPPEYANPSGPTPPEMVRPALRLFTGARVHAPDDRAGAPAMAGSGR